jgi:hypothetical protein
MMQAAPDSRSPARRLLAVAAAVGLVAKRLLGAVVLGVATILLVKREPERHWSEPPIIQMADEYDPGGRSGEPDPGRAGPRQPAWPTCTGSTARERRC